MSTEVRTFRAPTMQAALDLVRQELGREAVILHTRQVAQRRRLLWRKAPEEVEVTASLDVNVRPPAGIGERAAASAQYTATQSAPSPTPQHAAAAAPPVSYRDYEPAPRQHSGIAPTPSPYDNADESPRPSVVDRLLEQKTKDDVSFTSGYDLDALRVPTMQPPGTIPPPLPPTPQLPHQRSSGEPQSSGNAASLRSHIPRVEDPTAEFTRKLDSIQRMLEQLGRSSRSRAATNDIPAELFDLYTGLIDADVEDDLARDLVFRVRENCPPETLKNPQATGALLTGIVESDLLCQPPIETTPGRRKVVALIGATGVGKTTTIAKLAANFRLRAGVRVGLVTVDTYRIAAVEQLRTYAEIIDLPMKVVTSAQEMRGALDELTGLDLVLIDTAGRSPRDEEQLEELRSLLAEAGVDETLLVMSMTSSPRSLEATAQKFASAGTTGLILTKLDEAAGLGGMLSVTRSLQLPIRYVTTGQDVPDDIEPARAARLARLLLGQEQVHSHPRT